MIELVPTFSFLLYSLRPIPGYRGYIPRHPQSNNHLTDEECVTASMCSTTRQTHRYITQPLTCMVVRDFENSPYNTNMVSQTNILNLEDFLNIQSPSRDVSNKIVLFRTFPSMAYHQLQYCHKGPLSRTVTLTYPYNPFNKIQKPVEDCKDWH